MEVKGGSILAHTIGGNIRKFNFTYFINGFSTHDIRSIISLLDGDHSIHMLRRRELATFYI